MGVDRVWRPEDINTKSSACGAKEWDEPWTLADASVTQDAGST